MGDLDYTGIVRLVIDDHGEMELLEMVVVPSIVVEGSRSLAIGSVQQ